MKKPLIAFFLNLIFFGAGYIYNGKRKGLGMALILAWVVMRIGEIKIYLTGLVQCDWLILFCGIVVLQFSLAADAYMEAKTINGQKN